MKNKKYLKTLKLLGLALCVFGIFMAVNIPYAQAGVLDLAGKSIIDIFSWGITIILYILSTIFASILMIGGWVFDWTLNLNSAILQNPAVRVGWPIARDVTNLGFVLLIIIIAFSTILRMGNFTAQKALPKLIIAALLINFSLLFVGIFLDFAGILTNFFINQGITGSGNGVGISQAIIGMMNIVNILKPPDALGSASAISFGTGMLTFIANLFFINIITAITAITMWAMAAMFLIRYVMLGFLIILMPLAILAWVIGREEWGAWFSNLTKYTIFAPISSLFIYLAIATAQEFGGMQISAQQASVAPGLAGITANIGSMIMIIAILMFGLAFAEKAAGMGAINATKAAQGAMKFIGKTGIKGMMAPARWGKAGLDLAATRSAKANPLGWGARHLLRVQKFQEGIIRAKQKVGKVAEFGGESGMGSIFNTALRDIGGPMGFKFRHTDDELRKKRQEKQDKLEEGVKIKAKAEEDKIPPKIIDDLSKEFVEEKDNSKLREKLKQIKELKKQFIDASYDDISKSLTIAGGNFKDAKAEIAKSSSAQHAPAVAENDQVDILTGKIKTSQAKLTQLQSDLSRENLAINPNSNKILQLNKDIATAQADIAKAQSDIKNITG